VAYFSDAQDVYDTLGALLTAITADDDELAAKLRSADTIVRYEYSEPDASITVHLDESDAERVQFGDSADEPEVTMRMAADTAHRFWLGELDVTRALARGEITASGPVAKVLRLVPLAKPAFPRYRQLLIDQGRAELTEL
jgi:putative sterol carrier protein